jgi:hypothetical protein
MRASEGNLQGVLDELPAVTNPNGAGSFGLPAATAGINQSKQS